ncbi:MAG: fibronectin type III domain-containing protein [Patescibacteria group bacterium]|nr:fibronectin type III domain-containing protein [Patescibacteria group bacterium]
MDFCSYRGATSQATSASCRVGNDVCPNLLSAVGIPESACASGTCDCCGPCLEDGVSGCISAGDCCNHNCVGGVCQSPPCAPSCPDPSTYCANQHPSNGCGGSCSTPGTKQPSCPAPSTYCLGQEPDNGCGQKCPAGTKTPNCSCAANTCTGSTCSNGCGGTCAGTKDCTNYPTCSLRNLSCPTSANVGSNFNVSYEYFNTGPSSPYEVRMGLTNIQPAAGCTSGSGDVLWCQSSNINGQGSWSSESRTVKCPVTAGNLKITAGCFADTGSFTCPANTYSGGNINEKQECTVNCVAPATCTPDTSQACCTGATNLWDNTATNPNKATATGVWLLSSQFPESAPPNNQAQCCSDDASEVYISPTNARACDGTAACCNANDYVMNGQCYTAFSLPSPANVHSTAQTTISITWAWNAVSGATYYLAHLNNNTPVNVGNVTTRLQSGLTPNTSYWLEVAACNLCGCSAYSPRVTVNTLSGNQPPGQPTLEPVP